MAATLCKWALKPCELLCEVPALLCQACSGCCNLFGEVFSATFAALGRLLEVPFRCLELAFVALLSLFERPFSAFLLVDVLTNATPIVCAALVATASSTAGDDDRGAACAVATKLRSWLAVDALFGVVNIAMGVCVPLRGRAVCARARVCRASPRESRGSVLSRARRARRARRVVERGRASRRDDHAWPTPRALVALPGRTPPLPRPAAAARRYVFRRFARPYDPSKPTDRDIVARTSHLLCHDPRVAVYLLFGGGQ